MNLSLNTVIFFNNPVSAAPPPKVAISACLRGEPVRYDGTDKSLESTLAILDKYLHLIPICPEVGAGMSVPRPPVQLVETENGNLQVRGRDDASLDVTDALSAFSRRSLARFGPELCGYIVKSRSPSCGFNSTPVFDNRGEQRRLASGIHADYFHSQQPWLQIVDEIDLQHKDLCQQFIARCLILADLRAGCHRGALRPIHQHYTELIEQMAAPHCRGINNALDAGDPQCYWQAFGLGLQSLGSDCNH